MGTKSGALERELNSVGKAAHLLPDDLVSQDGLWKQCICSDSMPNPICNLVSGNLKHTI